MTAHTRPTPPPPAPTVVDLPARSLRPETPPRPRTPPTGAAATDLLPYWPAQRPLAVLVGDPTPAPGGPHWPTLLGVPGEPIVIDTASLAGNRGLLVPPQHTDAAPAGWIGAIAYTAGRVLEPRAGLGAAPTDEVCVVWTPLLAAWRRDASGGWSAMGRAELLPDLSTGSPNPDTYTVGRLTSDAGCDGFVRRVERTIEYIRAGDIFQANIAHRLRAPFDGSPRALAADLLERAGPAHGAYVEPPHAGRVPHILSLSPELFLTFDARTRGVTTRPMKGTRRVADFADAHDATRDLLASPKDGAELAMIIDLMRNDLGRVCRLGSIRVAEPRRVEEHAGGALLQSVGVVEGVLAEGRSLADLLAAAFPAGSVTGAPKIRAMQIIDELETSPRETWCGSVGYVHPDGSAAFNVAIRTATISRTPHDDGAHGPSVLDYHVGAGIVADSDPDAEWDETIAKASILLDTLGRTPGDIA